MTTEIYERISVECVDKCMSQRKVYERVKILTSKKGRQVRMLCVWVVIGCDMC